MRNLCLNPLGYMEVLRHGEVHGASGGPRQSPIGALPDGAQLEPVHGVALGLNPLEVSKAGVPAGLTRNPSWAAVRPPPLPIPDGSLNSICLRWAGV